MGIGENICFIYQGHKEWQGNKDQVMSATNEKLNDLVFASDLFRKVKKAEMEESCKSSIIQKKQADGKWYNLAGQQVDKSHRCRISRSRRREQS